MDDGVMEFVEAVCLKTNMPPETTVLEVGSQDVNGSVAPFFKARGVAAYTGVDIAPGPGVDVVCSVHELAARFGPESVDIVVSTEMLEHVEDWRSAITNMKAVLKRHGDIIITTRHWGFPYHGYPHDYWRFEVVDLIEIFDDFKVLVAETGFEKGVYLWARKPWHYQERPLTDLEMRPIGNYGKDTRRPWRVGHTN